MLDENAALIETPPPAAHVTSRSDECRAAMNVSYLSFPTPHEPARDAIRILIPLSRASFSISHSETEGRTQPVLVHAPFVSIIPAHQPHVIDGRERLEVIVITLDQRMYERRVREATGGMAPNLVGRYAAWDPFVREVGSSLHRDFQQRSLPGDDYLKSLAAVLAVHVARNYQSVGASACDIGLDAEKLIRVQAFVSNHLERALTVQQLADVIHMSPFHFARRFKQATGCTPHDYVTLQRVERSKKELRDSDLPLVDVAFDVGFKTQGHFTVVFHKAVGMTPRVYRLLNRRSSTTSALHRAKRMTADRLTA